MEIARDLFNVPARPGSRSSGLGILSRQHGCRHLGVRQSEDNSNGTRAFVHMQVDSKATSAASIEKLMKTREEVEESGDRGK